MQEVILVIHLILAVAIIALVLIQPAEAGGLVGGSSSGMPTPRRSGDVLSRATSIMAGCFFITSLLLAMTASRQSTPTSILDLAEEGKAAITQEAPETPPVPEKPKAPLSR